LHYQVQSILFLKNLKNNTVTKDLKIICAFQKTAAAAVENQFLSLKNTYNALKNKL
jgi:hypothetical protein